LLTTKIDQLDENTVAEAVDLYQQDLTPGERAVPTTGFKGHSYPDSCEKRVDPDYAIINKGKTESELVIVIFTRKIQPK